MKLKLWMIVLITFWIFIICFFNWQMGYLRGKSDGFDDAREMQKRIDCEIEFEYKPYSEIEGRCLKYFERPLNV